MPIYVLRDENNNCKEVFMNISERNKYSQKNANGWDIFTGDISERFPDACGEICFYPNIPGNDVFLAMNVKYPPMATRKFGDKHTTPSFKESPWYK